MLSCGRPRATLEKWRENSWQVAMALVCDVELQKLKTRSSFMNVFESWNVQED